MDRVQGYHNASEAVSHLLDQLHPFVRPGDRVLVKPNLVAGKNARLSCTHPDIVAGTCKYLKDHGVRICVADSPAFGSARGVASAAGMTEPLAKLGVQVETLRSGMSRTLNDTTVTLSRTALEADLIVNLPKLKAHSQMRVTAGVKNLFGCVTGMRKALLHATHGDKGTRFESLIVDIMLELPPQLTLIDGIMAMHTTGPIAGTEYPLGLLSVSDNTVAADTAMCTVLGLSGSEVPIWKECLRRNLPGADPARNDYPLFHPEALQVHDFQLPHTLKPQSFRPPRLLLSSLRRLSHFYRSR